MGLKNTRLAAAVVSAGLAAGMLGLGAPSAIAEPTPPPPTTTASYVFMVGGR